ncbi:Nuclear poly(A) polymerase 4 [Camellia lanceoleosa]|uniref:Nuclear poly(A) polymerase 4 n=1 Tax=Camellia lanceoleosa TaxID=1840588 RepID=A0ACC0GD13_9ERIC|nr:Nuclear poly(A) polymerase 4 [Camellia lanceoleosa]
MFFINVDRSSNNPQFEAQAHRTQPQQFALVVLHQSQRFLFFIDLEANRVRTWHQMVQNPISSYIPASTADLMSSSMGKKCTAYLAVKLNVVLGWSTLCVGPFYVNREEDFFFILHDILLFWFVGVAHVLDASCIRFTELRHGAVCTDLDISMCLRLYNVDEPTLESQWSEGGRPDS